MSDEVLKAVVDRVAYLESKVEAMSKEIAMWVREYHRGWCEALANNPCNCGADATNAARAEARKLAGLED